MKIQIVNVSVAQSAKVVAVLYTVFYLPVLAIMALAGAFQGSLGLVLLAVVVAPLFYGLITFLFTGLAAWLYNVVARRVGGLEYSIKEMSDTGAKG